jgi:di/tricarboxylate transporter
MRSVSLPQQQQQADHAFCSLTHDTCITTTIGDGIKGAGLSAWGALTIVYLFNMVVTEILTNNAAAAITVPLGLAIAESLEVSAKPFIMAVLIASSASFMTPIGYQTNTVSPHAQLHILL